MGGRIQNEDVKSEAELIALGADKTKLPHDTKIYVTALGINKTLDQAITDGDISGDSSPLTTKGDLYTRNATVDDRLPVGANGTILMADSAEPTGLKYIAPSLAVSGYYGVSFFNNSSAHTNNPAAFGTYNNASYASPVVEGNALAPTIANDLAMRIALLPAGTYIVRFNGAMQVTGNNSRTQGQYRIYDGISQSSPVSVVICGSTGLDDNNSFGVEGVFKYATDQTNINFKLQSLRATGTGDVFVYTPAQFTIEKIGNVQDGANRELSNLLSPTKINEDLIFGEDGAPNSSSINTSHSVTPSEQTGDLAIQTGDSLGGTANSGILNIETGEATQQSGDLNVLTGLAASTVGNINIKTADFGINGGSIAIETGSKSSNSGALILRTGASGANSGQIDILTGTGADNEQSGNINIITGDNPASFIDGPLSGSINIKTGNGTAYSTSGEILVETGGGAGGGTSGRIKLKTGPVPEPGGGEQSGNIELETGLAYTSPGDTSFRGSVIVNSKTFRLPRHDTAPTGAAYALVGGDMYYDTVTNKAYCWNGSSWNALW